MPHSESRRIVFIDVLRLLAAVQMIQGHTLDALLASDLRHGSWFGAWTFARGLTSTAFLAAAGLACVLAQDGSRADVAAGRRRRLWRALRLVLIGYVMHAPLGLLFGQEPRAVLRQALGVDVLQCIGVSVALLELLALVPRRTVRAALACALGALCFGAAGPLDALVAPALAGGWLPLANYLSPRGGSLFPLLPWAGFVFWGMGVGLSVLPERGALARGRCALGLLAWGGALLVPALLGARLSVADGLQLSPGACALRLGLVLSLAAGLVVALEGRVRLPGLLARLASETLFLYVSHVLVLYAGGVGLARLIGPRLGPGAALLWAALLLLASSAGALGYRRAVRSLRRRSGGGTCSRPKPVAQTPSS